MWSGAQSMAARTEVSHSARVSPGAPLIRSTEVCRPTSLAQETTLGTLAGVWVRSSTASTRGTADCIPKETRVNPASFSRARSSRVTESGLASVVTSAPSTMPKRSIPARRIRARSSAGRRVGVPPPKNTVLSGRAGRPERVRTPAARSSSRIASSA